MRLLVTGTDTGVGKTVVAAGLCAWRRARGDRFFALKPVESGVEDVPLDGALLARCAGQERAWVYALDEPLAPVVAARRQGVSLDVGRLDAAIGDGPCVIEGVGGPLVEVVEGLMVADLPQRWDLRVLVVAGNRLGVLSHTLMAVEVLLARGADVAGVVLNTLHGEEPGIPEATNAAELVRTLPASVPLLGTVPWVPDAEHATPDVLAAAVSGFAPALLGA